MNALSHAGSPVPAAAVLQAPMVDFVFDSDTYTTLANADPVVSISLWREYTMKMLGITDEDARNPEYSPVYDDFRD